MQDMKIPHVEDTLIHYLKSVFKNVLPGRDGADDDIRYKIGQQEVIRHLEALNEAQKSEDPLSGL